MAVGHWLKLGTLTLLLLASIVAVLAVVFGNAYAGSHHAEEEGASAEAPEHAEEEEAEQGSRSVRIAGSILISTAGAGLVPLGLVLARRRRREDELLPLTAVGSAAEPVLRPTLALLSAGAAVIHFVVIPAHWEEWWAQGAFFVVAAIAQVLWAVWILVAPSRLIYLAGAAGNAAIAALWVVTRTAGIPAGPGAGEREAAEFADTLATIFELLIVVGALALARTAGRRAALWPRGALAANVLLSLAVAALTAASLLALVEIWAT